MQLPEDLPLFDGDKTRLTQVFVNLLANANKFAPEDSTVRIGAAGATASVLAWVEDEGPGPAAATTARALRTLPARRGAEPEPAGLGLGLWIVKSIIERHSGRVTFVRTARRGARGSALHCPVETAER